MQKLLTFGVVLTLLLTLFAQDVEPVSAPTDLLLKFETEGDVHQFHLGELIPVKFSYTAKTSGKYIWVGLSREELMGGRPPQVSCSPSAESVGAPPSSIDLSSFIRMLHAPCGGVGGGVGGECADCDSDVPLTTTAHTIGVPLNMYVRFRTPGTYTCEASSAEVTTTSRDEKIRPALLVKSNPIVLTITDDRAWAHTAATAYANTYDKLCRGDDPIQHRSIVCFDAAQRITYLDTVESLATEVRVFDGKAHGWENGFWDAVQRSSYPQEALRLMTSRMQEPDFQVSTIVLEWLASSELRMEVPDAFQSGMPETYHAQAIEKLRKYVRLLGSSLTHKDPNVLQESAKTYRVFAEQNYCERQPLISTEEQNQVLTNLGVLP